MNKLCPLGPADVAGLLDYPPLRFASLRVIILTAHLYTVSGAVRPAGGCCVLRTRWGATLPKPHVRQQRQNIRFASIPFPLAYTPRQ